PEWYILDRKYFQDYQSYKSDAERVGNIGKVFPLVFFIVAALVCLTTMTRMVDEERTQIGTLKALGYGKLIIIRKYIAYAMLATILGSVAGALVGGKVLPMVIMNVYKMLYPNLEGMELPYNLEHSLVASGASVVCILAATLFACVKTLMENPANLMRPVAPRQGRKLILERIPALWRHIPFTWKNALRNFVRYKKRLFMTLFGIIGSTALLLVGFGIGDAVNTILYAQYGEVFTYNEVLGVNPDAKEGDIKALEDGLKKDQRFRSYTFVYQSFMDAENPLVEETKEAYLFVPDDVENISRYVTLQDRITKEPRYMNDDTVLISEKMSKTLNLKPGDTMCLSVDHDNKKEMTVGGIVENYVQNYVYMTPALYKKLYK
ncbi:MAG: ABC transporter permease, partial [Parasporobacterium sp.]|nr:ABC transporter permease [Parasporobacterium sp.]